MLPWSWVCARGCWCAESLLFGGIFSSPTDPPQGPKHRLVHTHVITPGDVAILRSGLCSVALENTRERRSNRGLVCFYVSWSEPADHGSPRAPPTPSQWQCGSRRGPTGCGVADRAWTSALSSGICSVLLHLGCFVQERYWCRRFAVGEGQYHHEFGYVFPDVCQPELVFFGMPASRIETRVLVTGWGRECSVWSGLVSGNSPTLDVLESSIS